MSCIAIWASISSSTLGRFVYIGTILLASPGLLGCGQHNIFRARTFSTGIASEDVVNGRLLYFLCFHTSFKILPLLFTSDDTKKKKKAILRTFLV